MQTKNSDWPSHYMSNYTMHYKCGKHTRNLGACFNFRFILVLDISVDIQICSGLQICIASHQFVANYDQF